MEKRLIVTRSDDSQSEMAQLTHPIIKRYADRCQADFQVLSDNMGYTSSHYRILKLWNLLVEYDRVLSIDTDTLIMNKCPDLFKMVPTDMIGTIFEDVGTREGDRRDRIRKVQAHFGDVGWKTGYINTGCAMFPSISRDIFEPLEEHQLWQGLGYDDVWLGYQINKRKLSIFELPKLFNFMSMFSEPWNHKQDRFEAFIIHYAGQGGFLPGKGRIALMKEDYLTLSKYGYI